MTDAEIKKDVTSKIGKTVGTVWGPCTVIGMTTDAAGVERIVLKEDQEEFTVLLKDWTVATSN